MQLSLVPKKLKKLKPKLIFLFCITGITPLIIGSALTYKTATESLDDAEILAETALRDQASANMNSLAKLKQISIETYFKTVRQQLLTFSSNSMVIDTMRRLPKAHRGFAEDMQIRPDGAANTEEIRASLLSYYQEHYDQSTTPSTSKGFTTDAYLSSLPPSAASLQFTFVSDNKQPFGGKHKLSDTNNFSPYERVHKRMHPAFLNIVRKLGYEDILLVDTQGTVTYSVKKGPEFATNLSDGYFSNTPLSRVVKKAQQLKETDSFVFEDFAPYSASHGLPYGFIASPVFHGEKPLGTVVYKLSIDRINNVMSQGTTNANHDDAYLIGPDGKLRSDSIIAPQTHNVKESLSRAGSQSLIDSNALQAALSGQTGIIESKNLTGEPSLTAFTPVKITDSTTWVMIAQTPTATALDSLVTMSDAALSSKNDFQNQFIQTILGSVILIMLIAWVTARSLSRPVKEMVDNLCDLSQGEGDLQARLAHKSDDEFGDLADAFNQFVTKLEQTIAEATTIVEPLSEASGNVQQSSKSLVEGTDRQAQSLSDTATAINDIASKISVNSQNAAKAKEASQQTAELANEASEVVKAAVQAMAEITDSSNRMVEITTAIEEIAFQTNLLALNAAVEAARAGEQGRGFAVVASEVRSLAQRSAESSQEIRELIEQSVQRIARGSNYVNQSGDHLQQIFQSVREVSEMVTGIASSSAEQSSNVTNVNRSVHNMDQVVQDNVSRSEELLALANSLDSNSTQLEQTLSRFKTNAQLAAELNVS